MGSQRRDDTSPNGMRQLVDWTEIDRLLAGVSAAAKGKLGCPPLALLLTTCHDL